MGGWPGCHGQEQEHFGPPPPARRETTSQLGLDELLARWETRGASRSLDVKFSLSDRSSKWDDETFEGRFVRQSPDRSCMELVKVVGQTKAPSQKVIRDGKRFYLYRYDTKQVVVLPSNDWRDTKDVGSALRSLLLASPLRLSGYLDGDSCPRSLRSSRGGGESQLQAGAREGDRGGCDPQVYPIDPDWEDDVRVRVARARQA